MSILETVTKVVANTYPKAIFKLLVDGVDISPIVSPRLMSLTITDNRGLEADSLEFEISDHDGAVALPRKETSIQVWIGWSDSGLVYKGIYTVNEVEYSGAPDTISIRAMSADLKKTLKQKKERSWALKTIGDIIATVARDHGLTASIHDSLASRQVAHIDQNESDANLITRIADEHDAIATVKNGVLLFMPTGSGQTVSGLDLPAKTIIRQEGDGHRYSVTSGNEEVSAVKAYYYDAKLAKKLEVVVGDASNQNIKELRHIHRDKQSAELAATAKFKRMQRAAATFNYTLAKGDPECIPEMVFLFSGLKPDIDDIHWMGTNISHNLSADGGFTTSLQLEVLLPDADDIAQLFEDERDTENEKFTGVAAYYADGAKAIQVTKGDQKNPKVFLYLYDTKEAAQARLDREYACLDLETGKFTEKNELDIVPYTGIKVFYSTDNKKTKHELVIGDQRNPKLINRLFKTKKAAQKALEREYEKLKARNNQISQIKARLKQ